MAKKWVRFFLTTGRVLEAKHLKKTLIWEPDLERALFSGRFFRGLKSIVFEDLGSIWDGLGKVFDDLRWFLEVSGVIWSALEDKVEL